MSLHARKFEPTVCKKCTGKNNGMPPCIRPHRVNSGGNPVFRAIDSPGGMCGYYASWPELAAHIVHGNYAAFDDRTRRIIRDGLKPLLDEFCRLHKGADIRSAQAAEACHYAKVGDEEGYVVDKDKSQNFATIVSILSVPTQDPLFPDVLRYFAKYVTKKVERGTKWSFCTCSGKSVGLGPVTAASADVVLIDPTGNKWRYRLTGAGIGKLSPTPVGGTYSQEDWWSNGYVYNLTDSELEKEDLAGACSFGDVALVLGGGLAGTAIWTQSALIFLVGKAAGTPGVDKCAGTLELVGASNDTKC
jgi:hypothetical protein